MPLKPVLLFLNPHKATQIGYQRNRKSRVFLLEKKERGRKENEIWGHGLKFLLGNIS
jgi:hypothetical protein